ncbi:MAG: tetratricopeptide repeat protein [Anaerolineales bacterium]|nr:tetratricopeptide repeat protein [Anaerolineales bacterium]
MAATNLREYLSGIDQLIDSNQVEDALAHCRHVLKTYPKNIATYRLMGKAYLESKRHSEASDLFQRVLSSIPDDFVAHIGMSIIREDEGNLDAAIWQMERAFESQPSNKAVQGEMRRLYGLREGYEPPKVRLTRGALARMYSHGDLFNQAIGELNNALAEDAQRPDLQVLLAEMHYKNNQPDEASAVCSQIIQKLPYCLYANRVMVDILRNSQRDVEATPYWERVEELDPYAAQVSTLKDVDDVPADSVMIDALELDSPMLLGAPGAAAGETDSEYEKEDLPGWLSVEDMDAPTASDVVEPDSVMSSLEGLEPVDQGLVNDGALAPHSPFQTGALEPDDIPDWLRELRPSNPTASLDPDAAPGKRWTEEFEQAGFQPTGPLDLGDVEAHEAAQAVTGDAAPDEAAPETNEGEPQASGQATGRPTGWLPTGELRWLDTAFTEEDGAPSEAAPERPVPEWLAEMNEDALAHTQPTRPAASALGDTPAFIDPEPELRSDILDTPDGQADTVPTEAEESAAAAQPNWLNELQASSGMADDDSELPRTDELNDAESTQRLDALAGWQTPTEDPSSMQETAAQPEAQADEPTAAFTEPQAEAGAPADEGGEEDETLSWLEGLAARRGVAEDELLTDPAQRSTAKPDWMQAEQGEQPEQAHAAAPKLSENLGWLDELAAAAGPVDAATDNDAAQADAQRGLEEDSPFSQELSDEALTSEPAEDATPGWLRHFTGSLEEQPADEPIAPRPLDDAPDWLSDLRPQDTDSLRATYAGDEDEAPQWPSEPDAVEPETAEAQPEPAAEPTNADAPVDDTPDWLRRLAQAQEPAWDAASEQDAASQDETEDSAPAPVIEPRWVPASQLPATSELPTGEPDSEALPSAQDDEGWAHPSEESNEATYEVETLAADGLPITPQAAAYAEDEYELEAEPAREISYEPSYEAQQPEAEQPEAEQPEQATPQAELTQTYEQQPAYEAEPARETSHEDSYENSYETSYEAEQPEPEAHELEFAAAATETAAAAAPRKRARGLSPEEVQDRLAEARQALSYGNLGDAAEAYSYFLRRRIRLDEVIADLRAASRRFPRQVAVWQTLGDAYMRNNQLTEALDCYTRAKSLL